jgi:hypothetical protein
MRNHNDSKLHKSKATVSKRIKKHILGNYNATLKDKGHCHIKIIVNADKVYLMCTTFLDFVLLLS